MENKYLKNILFLILFLSFCFLGLYFYHHSTTTFHQKLLVSCSNLSDEQSILECSYDPELSYQEKYDIFYKNHTHSLRIDNSAVAAYRECQTHQNICSTHDESVFFAFINECAMTNSMCLSVALDKHNPQSLTIFQNSVMNNIEAIIPQPCRDSLHSYFLTLSMEQKNKLDSRIVKTCSD